MMDILTYGVPIPVALALVAVLGYFAGRRSRQLAGYDDSNARRELTRANAIIRELETITQDIRKNLATHHANILQFTDRVSELSTLQDPSTWVALRQEAEKLLNPTMRLAKQVAQAYDQIRQQTNLLMTFTDVRSDPLTGLSNRRAMQQSLSTLFAMMTRYGTEFSLAIFEVDHFDALNEQHGHREGDRMLKEIAQLFNASARETDIIARYAGEVFVVIMPQTDLDGACVFSQRMRGRVEQQLSLTLSAGTAAPRADDTPRTLLSRSDSALYSAKAAGRNCVFRHTGSHIEPVEKDAAQPQDDAQPAAPIGQVA